MLNCSDASMGLGGGFGNIRLNFYLWPYEYRFLCLYEVVAEECR